MTHVAEGALPEEPGKSHRLARERRSVMVLGERLEVQPIQIAFQRRATVLSYLSFAFRSDALGAGGLSSASTRAIWSRLE